LLPPYPWLPLRLAGPQALSVDEHLHAGWQCMRGCSTIKQTALPYAMTLVSPPAARCSMGSPSWRPPLQPGPRLSYHLPLAPRRRCLPPCLQGFERARHPRLTLMHGAAQTPAPHAPLPPHLPLSPACRQMCTGFIEVALILLPVGFIGRHYHPFVSSQSNPTTPQQRAVGVAMLIGLYLIINLLLLGADEVRSSMQNCNIKSPPV
jgi:hypothetical protein